MDKQTFTLICDQLLEHQRRSFQSNQQRLSPNPQEGSLRLAYRGHIEICEICQGKVRGLAITVNIRTGQRQCNQTKQTCSLKRPGRPKIDK